MSPAGQLTLGFLIAVLSYIMQFLWFVLKVVVAVGLLWGMLLSIDPFPVEIISCWQGKLLSADFGPPAMEFLAWFARNWPVVAVFVILFASVRSYRIVKEVGQTAGHSAYASSALANYLDIEPTTPRLLKLQREPTHGFFGAIFKEGAYSRIMSIFGGVPFLPDEAIPGRKGEVASYRDDFRKYLSMAEAEPPPLESMLERLGASASAGDHDFGWDNDRESQELWIGVESWQYKVFVRSFKGHSTLFQFEGAASQKSCFKGLRVDGEIIIPLAEPSSDARGHFFLQDGIFGAQLRVNLWVVPETFKELVQVFSGECASKNGGIGLNLRLRHPKGAEPGFWRSDWRKETIQISEFEIFSGGRFKRYAT